MSTKKELSNDPFLFFPIDTYFNASNVLTAAIYSYRINSKYDADQPFSTIYDILNINSSEYPKSILVSDTRKGSANIQTHLFFLTRILAMVILLEFDKNKYQFMVILTNKLHKDPIDALNMLTDLEKSSLGNDINQLIRLLVIFIKFSDYDIESVSNFSYSFNNLFLSLIKLKKYGQNEFIYLKQESNKNDNDDDDDTDDNETSLGISIIKNNDDDDDDDKFQEVGANILKYCFLSNNNDKNDENSYAAIISTNKKFSFSAAPSEVILEDSISDQAKEKYEINLSYEPENKFIESLEHIPLFRQSIEDKDDESKPKFSHFKYFTQKMDVIYNRVKSKIESFDQKEPINEFYSIIYNITIFNYYIAKITKENEKDYEKVTESSFILNFLELENYLILLLEGINQFNNEYLINDMENCIYKIYRTCEFLIKESKNKKKSDEENNNIIEKLNKFSIIMILLAVKTIFWNNEHKKYFLEMIIFLIDSDKGKKKDWIKKYFGYEPTEKNITDASKNISSSFKYSRNDFKPSLKVSSLMNRFHLVSCSFALHNEIELIDVITDLKKYNIKFK